MHVLYRFGKYGYHQEEKKFDAAFKLRVVEYAEQDTNRVLVESLVLMKRIVAALEL